VNVHIPPFAASVACCHPQNDKSVEVLLENGTDNF